jgi:hypothetical protein
MLAGEGDYSYNALIASFKERLTRKPGHRWRILL